MTGVAKHTVLNLLRDLGCASAEYHHRNVRSLRVRRLQCDEIWAFVGAKKKNVTPDRSKRLGRRLDLEAMDADTKLCVTYYVGDGASVALTRFMQDAANRIVGRPQVTTDALQALSSRRLNRVRRGRRLRPIAQDLRRADCRRIAVLPCNVHRLRHENRDR